jgi:predicted porin
MKILPTLMTTAAVLATTPVFAQSNVQLNGVVDLFAGQRQLAGGVKLKKLDSGGMTTSRWGVDGSEDLGGGLKAQFSLQSFIRADTGDAGRTPTDRYWARFAYVGVQGAFGTVRLGRLGTPTFGTAIRFSPFADSTTFSPWMLHMYTGGQPLGAPMNTLDSAADNSIGYIAPAMGGFNFSGNYSFGELAGASSRRRFSLGAGWAGGPFAVGVATEQSNITGAVGTGVTKVNNIQAGVSYDLGAAKLFGTYGTTETTLAAGTRDHDTWQLGATVKAGGAGRVMLTYVQTTKSETTLADVKRRTVGLGYDHTLSKRTDLYTVLLSDRLTGVSTGTTLVAGVRHRF